MLTQCRNKFRGSISQINDGMKEESREWRRNNEE